MPPPSTGGTHRLGPKRGPTEPVGVMTAVSAACERISDAGRSSAFSLWRPRRPWRRDLCERERTHADGRRARGR